MTESEAVEQPRKPRGTKIGVVASSKMDKSVVVRVDRTVLHSVYKRYVRRSARFMAHDGSGICKVGDTVEIVETRPLSKRKRWRVRRVVRSAVGTARTTEAGSA